MKIFLLIFVFFLVGFFVVQFEEELVCEVVEKYIEGFLYNFEQVFFDVFYEDVCMFLSYLECEIWVLLFQEYVVLFVDCSFGEYNGCKGNIFVVDVENDIVMVKVEIFLLGVD